MDEEPISQEEADWFRGLEEADRQYEREDPDGEMA